MGLREDLEWFQEIGEERRQDLTDFIQHGELGGQGPDSIKVPIKVINLPEFQYDQRDQGGVGMGQGGMPQPGQPVGQPEDGKGDGDGDGDEDGDEPGEEGGEHAYEMDPEEFAKELDEELGLDLEPKGKEVVQEKEGDYTDTRRQGPSSMLDVDELVKRGMKRHIPQIKDEEYLQAALMVADTTPRDVYRWARQRITDPDKKRPPIKTNLQELRQMAAELDEDEKGRWESFEEMTDEVEYTPTKELVRQGGWQKDMVFHHDDERYRDAEIIKEYEANAVLVLMRDVSGSMREKKRELVERVYTPMDWYLRGKYENMEIVYIAHDADAWEEEREKFFGINSGGGTRISSAYELAQEILEEQYPWETWNRYVFEAGDGENSSNDSEQNVLPLIDEIDANIHGYVETQPGASGLGQASNARHGKIMDDYADDHDNAVATFVGSNDDVADAIYDLLSVEGDDE